MDSIIGGYEPPCACRELNSEPTTTESFLQSPEKNSCKQIFHSKIKIMICYNKLNITQSKL